MSSTSPTPAPGLRNQSGVRRVFRVLGLVLAPVGVLLVAVGFYRFVTFDDSSWDSGTPDGFLMFALGGIVAVVGLGLLSAGYMGATSRYAAGETMPVVKDSLGYIFDREGGRPCRGCGASNDGEAKFCDRCGAALA